MSDVLPVSSRVWPLRDPTLDVSGLPEMQTADGYWHYVCHVRGLLTPGFATVRGLARNADIVSARPAACDVMRARYWQTFRDFAP